MCKYGANGEVGRDMDDAMSAAITTEGQSPPEKVETERTMTEVSRVRMRRRGRDEAEMLNEMCCINSDNVVLRAGAGRVMNPLGQSNGDAR